MRVIDAIRKHALESAGVYVPPAGFCVECYAPFTWRTDGSRLVGWVIKYDPPRILYGERLDYSLHFFPERMTHWPSWEEAEKARQQAAARNPRSLGFSFFVLPVE